MKKRSLIRKRRIRLSAPIPKRNPVAEFNSLVHHERAMLSMRDMRNAFSVSRQQVHNWIEAGLVVAGDIGCGVERQHWKVTRASASAFYCHRFSEAGA